MEQLGVFPDAAAIWIGERWVGMEETGAAAGPKLKPTKPTVVVEVEK